MQYIEVFFPIPYHHCNKSKKNKIETYEELCFKQLFVCPLLNKENKTGSLFISI